MFAVVVTEKGGDQRRLEFDKPEVNIGRVQGNDVILPKGNVSKRHSRVLLKDEQFVIVDLKSTNGTYVNGRKIGTPTVIKANDKIYIGDFILHLEELEDLSAATPVSSASRRPPPPPPKRRPRPTAADHDMRASDLEFGATLPPGGPPTSATPGLAPHRSSPGRRPPAGEPPPPLADVQSVGAEDLYDEEQADEAAAYQEPPPPKPPRSAAPRSEARARAPERQRASISASRARSPVRGRAADPRRSKLFELQKDIHDQLIEYLDLRRMDIDQLGDEELWEKTENAICDIVESMDSKGQIPAFVDQDSLIKDVLNEALGLGPLEDLLAEASVDEIMVNRSDQIYVERRGRIELTSKGFSSDKAVLGVIERIVTPLGRRIDEASPLVDARLKDGSRVNAIIPPLAIKGPCLTIRKFRRDMLAADDLIRMGTLNGGMIDFLNVAVNARRNIVISGGTGSGKTTTLNVVSNAVPTDERIVTIEDAAELQLKHEHWVQLESRPANIEGSGAIGIRELVRNSLRMRPDRIIVGECRGGEALDMLQAMNTGHDGSLTTAHSNSPRDTLARLETMVLMAGMDLPIRAIREQVASAIDIIVHQTRMTDGSRRVTHVTEISGMEGDVITMQDIFTFKQEGFDESGNVRGRFVPSGFVPRFYEDMQRRGIDVDMGIFREA